MKERPLLFYKDVCAPCQWMSRLAVILSFGAIRRIPVSNAKAKEFYVRFPDHEGQLILIDHERVVIGRLVFAAVPRLIITTWWKVLVRTVAL